MAEVVEFDDCPAEISGENDYRSRRPHAGRSGSEGGDMDDILKRLGAIESSVSGLRAEVSAIAAIIPHLATKGDIGDLRSETRTDIGLLRAELSGLETRVIKWMIATVLSSTSLAFTIAKFVH
jgi:hypothetical protein